MPQQDIVGWVQSQLKAGYSVNDIKIQLVSYGYPPSTVEDIFEALHKQHVQKMKITESVAERRIKKFGTIISMFSFFLIMYGLVGVGVSVFGFFAVDSIIGGDFGIGEHIDSFKEGFQVMGGAAGSFVNGAESVKQSVVGMKSFAESYKTVALGMATMLEKSSIPLAEKLKQDTTEMKQVVSDLKEAESGIDEYISSLSETEGQLDQIKNGLSSVKYVTDAAPQNLEGFRGAIGPFFSTFNTVLKVILLYFAVVHFMIFGVGVSMNLLLKEEQSILALEEEVEGTLT